jgi:molybdopterin-binding protein
VTLTVPGEVSLSSSRNQLTGTITQLLPSGAQVRALVDCGFPLVALVTHRSVEEMSMVEGLPVVASFKATAAHVIPRS